MPFTNFKNDDSLRHYLKSQSSEVGISIKHAYDYFFGRNFLQKLSMLQEADILIKGSFVQFIHLGEMIRPTTDLDLISIKNHDKSIETLMKLIDLDFGDNIAYKLSTYAKNDDTGMIQMTFMSNYGRINHPVQVDLGIKNNWVYEHHFKPVPCAFSKDAPFYIDTPSHEEHLAEKLCIIAEDIDEEHINTRVKDFYDIYKLSSGKYDRGKLELYFQRHLMNRGKVTLDELSSEHLNLEYIDSHRKYWEISKKKYDFLDQSVPFEGAVYYTKSVLDAQIKLYRDTKPVYVKTEEGYRRKALTK